MEYGDRPFFSDKRDVLESSAQSLTTVGLCALADVGLLSSGRRLPWLDTWIHAPCRARSSTREERLGNWFARTRGWYI